MMLSKADFEGLDLAEKSIEVISNGKVIKTRLEDGYIVNLFLLNDFLVEVYFQKENNSISQINLAKEKDVDRYLDN